MDIRFYHVAQGSPDAVLPRLLQRALDAGLKVALRVPDAAERARLDRWLWEFAPTSFLPHGQEGGAHDPDQPVLLTAGDTAANDATMLIALEPSLPRSGYTRAALLFGEQLAAQARVEWKALKADGLTPTYWKQTAAGWEKAG